MADFGVFLEFAHEITLLYAVEHDDTHSGIGAVPFKGRPSLLNRHGYLVGVGVALLAGHNRP